jgi:hypothetical protein
MEVINLGMCHVPASTWLISQAATDTANTDMAGLDIEDKMSASVNQAEDTR